MEVGDEVKHASEKAVEATPAPNEMAQAFQRALAKDPYCPEDHQLTAEEFWGGATSFFPCFCPVFAFKRLFDRESGCFVPCRPGDEDDRKGLSCRNT